MISPSTSSIQAPTENKSLHKNQNCIAAYIVLL
jgi:hypothetical protein